MAKAKKKAPVLKEKCGLCGHTEFTIASDASMKRYCGRRGCSNVWGPMDESDLKVQAAHDDVMKYRGRAMAADNTRHKMTKAIGEYHTKLRIKKESELKVLIVDVLEVLEDIMALSQAPNEIAEVKSPDISKNGKDPSSVAYQAKV